MGFVKEPKNKMILSTKQHETFHQRLLMLFSFLLPLLPRLAILCIILCGLNWLLSGTLYRNFKLLLKPIPLLFIGFYLLYWVGMIYTSNWVEGMQRLETKLPLLIFPLMLFSFPLRSHPVNSGRTLDLAEKNQTFNYDSIFPVLISYTIGCLIASLYCMGATIIKYFETGENWMHYKKLGSFLGFHPTYFSMYISFALFIVLFFLVKNYKAIVLKNKLGSSILIGWFFIFILLLSSRMTILVTALILGVSFLIWMYWNGKLLKGIGVSFFAIIMLGISLKTLPGLKIRTNATIQRIEQQSKKQGVSDPRINLWSAAWTVIQKNLIIGTGTGDAQDELVKVYKKNNYERELRENYNPHNQYLQNTVTLGIVGGILLLFYLSIPFWMAFQKNDYLYLLFLALISLSFLTESILQTQRGTLFFGFFQSLFMMQILNSKIVKSIKKERHFKKVSLQ